MASVKKSLIDPLSPEGQRKADGPRYDWTADCQGLSASDAPDPVT